MRMIYKWKLYCWNQTISLVNQYEGEKRFDHLILVVLEQSLIHLVSNCFSPYPFLMNWHRNWLSYLYHEADCFSWTNSVICNYVSMSLVVVTHNNHSWKTSLSSKDAGLADWSSRGEWHCEVDRLSGWIDNMPMLEYFY